MRSWPQRSVDRSIVTIDRVRSGAARLTDPPFAGRTINLVPSITPIWI